MKFEKEAAISALLYISERVRHATYHRIAKVMYFADLLHLEKYGRTIFGAEYRAYEFGPVPHQVYGMLKAAEKKSEGQSLEGAFRVSRSASSPFVQALASANLDYLSASDIECLDHAIQVWGEKSFPKTTLASHDAAWEQAWRTKPNSVMPLESIVLTLKNGSQVLQHINNPHP